MNHHYSSFDAWTGGASENCSPRRRLLTLPLAASGRSTCRRVSGGAAPVRPPQIRTGKILWLFAITESEAFWCDGDTGNLSWLLITNAVQFLGEPLFTWPSTPPPSLSASFACALSLAKIHVAGQPCSVTLPAGSRTLVLSRFDNELLRMN